MIVNYLNSLGFQHIKEEIDEAIFKAVEQDDALEFARISTEDRMGYQVLCAGQEGLVQARALLAGGLRHKAQSRLDLPAVGDWVVVRWPEPVSEGLRGRADAMIWQRMPRRSRLLRQAAGERTDAQIIASNLDVLFIVTSMNSEFEPRRLERYILAAEESGAKPVIVLNKSDLAEDPEWFIAQAREVAPRGVSVIAISCLRGSAQALEPWLLTGNTCAIVGSSGVGKSTITNALMRRHLQMTSAIREDDDEGRHTTTARHLLVLPHDRGVLVDTPGMRELQLWAGEDAGLNGLFEDIEELARGCRFRDCQHHDEPGCAVLGALDTGELSAARLASWRKLGRELQWQARRQDVAAQRAAYRDRAKVIKQVTRMTKKR